MQRPKEINLQFSRNHYF